MVSSWAYFLIIRHCSFASGIQCPFAPVRIMCVQLRQVGRLWNWNGGDFP